LIAQRRAIEPRLEDAIGFPVAVDVLVEAGRQAGETLLQEPVSSPYTIFGIMLA